MDADREFYLADGREWYEPRPEDCEERISEVRTTVMHHTCMTCGQPLVPQMLRTHFVRRRYYTMKGMVPQWQPWSDWELVGFEHLNGCPEEVLSF